MSSLTLDHSIEYVDIIEPMSSRTSHSANYQQLKLMQEQEVGCCCCFGRAQESISHFTFNIQSSSNNVPKAVGATKLHHSVFHESNGALDFSNAESQFFFDAEETEELCQDLYPIVTTDLVKSKPRGDVCLSTPETMLGKPPSSPTPFGQSYGSMQRDAITMEQASGNSNEDNHSEIKGKKKRCSLMLKMKRSIGVGFFGRSTGKIRHETYASPIAAETGYPGALTGEELRECLTFVRELEERDIILTEIVFSLRGVEPDSYAVCRFLRASNFVAEAAVDQLEKAKDIWSHVKRNGFFQDIPKTLGIPESLFLSQYPFASIGRAKNGCPVHYVQAGKIDHEALFCLTSIDRIESYYWYYCMHKFKSKMREAQAIDMNFVRMETVIIIDLKDLSSSALSHDGMEVVKRLNNVAEFFPETIHCIIILNAPKLFSAASNAMMGFLNPRLVKRIQVYSNLSKGLKRVRQLIHRSQLPNDYGGLKPSIASAMSGQGNQQKLLYIKRRQGGSVIFNVEKDKRLDICVYTRSASSARFTLYRKEGNHRHLAFDCNEQGYHALVQGKVETNGTRKEQHLPVGGASPTIISPKAHLVATNVIGPGEFVLEGRDMDDSIDDPESVSRGYFLVVGTIL